MSPKRPASGSKSSNSSKQPGKASRKSRPGASAGKKTAEKKAVGKKPKKAPATPRVVKAAGSVSRAVAAKKPPPRRGTRLPEANESAAEVLERAESDLTAVIDSLNNQMNAAMATLTELAVSQRGRGKAVIRTEPLDRATATFQRLVAEVVEDKLGEMLGPLLGLYNELAQRAAGAGTVEADHADFYRRGKETLDQVLSMAGIGTYDARVGEPFDPLIHLAVGETHRDDLADGAVAEMLRPGFRSARGKVVLAAKVRVNRK